MSRLFSPPAASLLFFAVVTVAGCSSSAPKTYDEDFVKSDSATYSRNFPVTGATACDAGRRALLSQGYSIDKTQANEITGHKNFQGQGEDGQHTQISFDINCSADNGSVNRSTMFANAVQDRYSIKKTSNAASVGVSVLGSVSLPFGASDDSLVKTASQTISRAKFYDGFFELVQGFLPEAQAKSTETPAKPAAPAKAHPAVAKPAPATPATSAPAAAAPAATPPAASPATTAAPSSPSSTTDQSSTSGASSPPAASTPQSSGAAAAPTPPPASSSTPDSTTTGSPATSAPDKLSPAATGIPEKPAEKSSDTPADSSKTSTPASPDATPSTPASGATTP